MRKLLIFAAATEVATGIALMLDPGMVVSLLAGANEARAGLPLARFAGIALLALGLACWPARASVGVDRPAFRGMFAYNVLVATYLAYSGFTGQFNGVLLGPAIALHAGVALAMVLAWRREARMPAHANPGRSIP